MSKKEDILNKLFSLQRFGIKPGLERTLKLSGYLENPHLKFPSVHVAGTNGKGSVCALLASILMEAGYKVGLYTSPHLVNFNERIRINHAEISDDEMVELAEILLIGEEKWECTFFEINTVMAFEYFARNQIDIAIIETGMGGRFDSTNILSPLLSIIASIDLDHKEYLGNTLEEIAFEKAGIIKKNTPVIIPKYGQSVKNVIAEMAQSQNSILYDSSELCFVGNHLFNSDFTQSFDLIFKNHNYKNVLLGIAGKHQIGNVAEVITANDILTENLAITPEHIYQGLANVKNNTGLRGRIEPYFLEDRSQKSEDRISVNRDPGNKNLKLTTLNSQLTTDNGQPITDNPIILDTGHNPGAIRKLVESLRLHRPDIEKWNFVYGGMADKDIKSNLKIIQPQCEELILTRPQIDRAMELQKLKEIAEELQFQKIAIKPEVTDAVKYAIHSGKSVVISGSFYLAGEALPLLEKMLKFQS
ncbi:MAG: folylpolyglutamate synthase/dihydrofolate synthase family protein [bacterium]